MEMDDNGSPPSRASGSTGTPKLNCRVCGRLFSRREHLDRHTRSHTKEKPFLCQTCRRTFSRADSLRRHQDCHVQQDGSVEAVRPSGGLSRACKQCATSRVRCLRGNPCRRCSLRNLPCEYPPNDSNKTLARKTTPSGNTAEDGQAARSRETQAIPVNGRHGQLTGLILGDCLSATINGLEGEQDMENETPARVHAGNAGIVSIGAADFPSWTAGQVAPSADPSRVHSRYEFSVNQLAPQFDYDPISGTNFDHRTLLELNWLSSPAPDIFAWDFQHQTSTSCPNALPGPVNFSLASEVEQAERFSGLAHRVAESTIQECLPILGTSDNTVSSQEASPANSTSTSDMLECPARRLSLESSAGAYYVDGTGARAPFKRRQLINRASRATVTAVAQYESQISMMNENGQPPLIGVPSECLNIYHTLIAGTSLRGLHHTTCPSPAYINTCISLYFERFHPVFPFIRRAEIQNGQQPFNLLLAVAAIGARYTQSANLASFRDTLIDSLHQVLADEFYISLLDLPVGGLVSSRPAWGKDGLLANLQAGVLHVLSMLHSGQEALVKRAISARYYLVEACHRLRLLSSPETGPSLAGCDDDIDIPSWVNQQSRLRTGYMISILDFMFTYELNIKSLVRLGDANGPLPCHREAWETPSSRSISSAQFTSVTLQEALEMLYMEKRLPPKLSEFATTLVIQGIIRQAREAAHQSQLSLWTPSSAVQNRLSMFQDEQTRRTSISASRWRNCACDCLDIVHWSANSKAAGRAGWEHPTILQLHLSRLILLTPMTHIQALAAMSVSPEADEGETDNAAAARTQVIQWVVHDQYKARLCLVHAGALFWHLRRYSLDSIFEPFAIYMAVLVFWAYAVSTNLLRHQRTPPARHAVPETRSGTSGAATDGLGSATADRREAPPEAEPTPEPSFIHLDRPCDDELVQTYIRLGHKMSGYMLHVGDISDKDAPKKILQEGICLLRGAHRKVNPEAQEPGCTWGIEGQYADFLARMANASI